MDFVFLVYCMTLC